MKKLNLIGIAVLFFLLTIVGCKKEEKPQFEVQFESTGKSVAENSGNVTFKVQLPEGAQGSDVVVTYWIAGSASEGIDYEFSGTGTVTIPANQLEVTLTVSLLDNIQKNSDRNIIFTITGVTMNDQVIEQLNTLNKTYTLAITDDECSPYIAGDWDYRAYYWSYFQGNKIYTGQNGQSIPAGTTDSSFVGTVIIADPGLNRSYSISDVVVGQYAALGVVSPGTLLDNCGAIGTDPAGTALFAATYPVIMTGTISNDGNTLNITWTWYIDLANQVKGGGGEAVLTRSKK